jgi:hypothetical protein
MLVVSVSLPPGRLPRCSDLASDQFMAWTSAFGNRLLRFLIQAGADDLVWVDAANCSRAHSPA